MPPPLTSGLPRTAHGHVRHRPWRLDITNYPPIVLCPRQRRLPLRTLARARWRLRLVIVLVIGRRCLVGGWLWRSSVRRLLLLMLIPVIIHGCALRRRRRWSIS